MKRLTVLFMILILLGGCSIGMSDEKLLPKDMNEEDFYYKQKKSIQAIIP